MNTRRTQRERVGYAAACGLGSRGHVSDVRAQHPHLQTGSNGAGLARVRGFNEVSGGDKNPSTTQAGMANNCTRSTHSFSSISTTVVLRPMEEKPLRGLEEALLGGGPGMHMRQGRGAHR